MTEKKKNTMSTIYIFVYISSVYVYITELLLNGWPDFMIFFVCV